MKKEARNFLLKELNGPLFFRSAVYSNNKSLFENTLGNAAT